MSVFPLQRGSKGEAVLALQRALNRLDRPHISEDGIFGPKTSDKAQDLLFTRVVGKPEFENLVKKVSSPWGLEDPSGLDGQELIDQIIAWDNATYAEVLALRELIEQLSQAGVSVSLQHAKLRRIELSRDRRQALIRNDKRISVLDGTNSALESLENKWNKFIGIGAIPLLGYVAGVVVSLGLGAVIALAYTSHGSRAVTDWQETQKFKEEWKALLPSKQKEKFEKDVDRLVSQAYTGGRRSGMFSLFSNTGLILTGVGVAILYNKFKNSSHG